MSKKLDNYSQRLAGSGWISRRRNYQPKEKKEVRQPTILDAVIIHMSDLAARKL